MGRSSVILALLMPLTMLGVPGGDSNTGQTEQDRPTYRLDAKSEQLDEFNQFTRTTYTYYSVFRGQERELWRVSLDEKYIKHWIDREGNVWVVSAENSRLRPGTFGNSSEALPTKLWMRDTAARELGSLNLGQAQSSSLRASGQKDWGKPNLDTAQLLQTDPFKTRFVLPYSNGTELHVNRTYDNNQGYRCFANWTGAGKLTPLESLVDKEVGVYAKHPVPDRQDIEFWSRTALHEKGVLVVFESWPVEVTNTIRLVLSQSEQPAPDYLRVTPNKRILWFSFGGYLHDVARVDVFDASANLVGRVDFVGNGMFESAYAAGQALDSIRLEIKRGAYWVDIERADTGDYERNEVIGFTDSQNRFYQLTVPSLKDKDGKVTAERALASVKDLQKEPDYVGFEKTGEKLWKSESGTYAYRVRKFRNDAGRELSQQTLLRNEPNGLEHEYWSKNLYGDVLDAFVSESGRTLVVTSGEIKNANTDAMEPYVHLEIWDYRGQGYAADLTDKRFFGSHPAAKKAEFSNLQVLYEGDVQRRDFEGDDLLLHPREVYTWNTAGSTVKFSLETPVAFALPILRFIK